MTVNVKPVMTVGMRLGEPYVGNVISENLRVSFFEAEDRHHQKYLLVLRW